VTIDHADVFRQACILKNHGSQGLSEKPDGVHTGSNSGYQSLNIAVLSGGNPILLVAYDMKYQNGRSHSHNGHQIKSPEGVYKGFAPNFASTEAQLKKLGVKVINCSPDSAIKSFPKQPLGECLESWLLGVASPGVVEVAPEGINHAADDQHSQQHQSDK
jgi:hypothetical protein